MKDKDIKPIPKKIEKCIRELDKIRCPEQKRLRFYAYLTTINKELVKITVAIMILELIGKDKKFCKWLIANKQPLSENPYYIDVVIRSYKTGKSLDELQAYAEAVIILRRQRNLPRLQRAFSKDLDQLLNYVSIQKTGVTTYNDYYTACTYLGLDMTIPKNRYPHDFKRWHDIRIDEYRTAKALKDAEQRKELYAQFAIVAEKYLPLQRNLHDAFIVIIAKSPADLIREGDILHHCVGRMNYDQRMIREESLIFFIRNATEPDTPLATVEYSLASKTVLQCYGDHDSKPSQDVLEFVNNKWLPYANRKINKLKAAA